MILLFSWLRTRMYHKLHRLVIALYPDPRERGVELIEMGVRDLEVAAANDGYTFDRLVVDRDPTGWSMHTMTRVEEEGEEVEDL